MKCSVKPLSHYTALAQRSKMIRSAVISQEFFFIFVKMEYSTCSLLMATTVLLRSSHCILLQSYVEFLLAIACDLTALPQGCWRPYGAAIAIVRRYYQNAEGRRLFCSCSKQTLSLGILCDLSVLPQRCLRSYCPHLGVLQFLERRGSATIVWQGF